MLIQRVFKKLSDLFDVTLNGPTDGQVLSYNAAQSKWVNSAVHLPSTIEVTNLVAATATFTPNITVSGNSGSITLGDGCTLSGSGIQAEEGNFGYVFGDGSNLTNIDANQVVGLGSMAFQDQSDIYVGSVHIGAGGLVNIETPTYGYSPIVLYNEDYGSDVFTVSDEGYVSGQGGYFPTFETSVLQVYDSATIWGVTYTGGLAHSTGDGTTPLSVSSPLALTKRLSIAGPTVGPSGDGQPLINLSQTWNTDTSHNGKIFVANITNTQSYQFGLIWQIAVNGVNYMSISAKGDVNFSNVGAPYVTATTQLQSPNYYIYKNNSAASLRIAGGSDEQMQWGSNNTYITTACVGVGGTNGSLGPAFQMQVSGTNASSGRYGWFEFVDNNYNDATSGTFNSIRYQPTINQASGTATNNLLVINPTVTAAGSGGVYPIRIQRSSVDKWNLDDQGTQTLYPRSTTPANPSSSNEGRVYWKGGKYVIQYNDAGTVRYKYLDMTGTGVTWVHSTTAP